MKLNLLRKAPVNTRFMDLNGIPVFHLTDIERDRLKRKFAKIHYSPYQDFEKFESAAKDTARKYFPSKLYAIISDLKKGMNKGILLIKNLPTDSDLIETPASNDFDFNQKKTFVSEACSVGIASILGEIYGYRNEKRGNNFHNNFPTVVGIHQQSNEGSKEDLAWHSEDAHTHPYQPDYVMLFCLRTDRDRKAKTYLLNSGDVIKKLTPEVIEQLRKKEYMTTPPASFGNDAVGHTEPMSVLSGCKDMPTITVSFNKTVGINPTADKALQIFMNICRASEDIIEICLDKSDELLFDNRPNIHGRSSFQAYFDGQDRWLQRVFVKEGGLRTWKDKLFNPKLKTVNF